MSDIIKDSIKTIPDYPKPGIQFRDVTSLMQNPVAFSATIDRFAAQYQNSGFTAIVGTEARGFIFGAPLAYKMNVPFIPVRKPGKLPRDVISQAYILEYGEDILELHTDALSADDKVLMVDDLLATGGTIEATTKLIRKLGAHVEDACFVVNLPELGGEKRLTNLSVNSFYLTEFEGE
ncbi:adenine phosphoribosyltransferase [Psychrosphaera sp. B3R10]|uniref:adenine phosphoribosyltransferase n=1 Tax=unclassified Psychrosphaera TaxID=2641570 RepID=UPI001C08AE31|nr:MULTISPECIES: adenine phosphoribosyltransferase [unclassified Psychrosphaera]MBU2883944.1 adenine phosphoribosyltransferase [Psychrosphaera sp. I2R16]MBU2990349.1 adenine phosphoribosyltransferase [Psychrosphaera sp. B3R10]